VGELDCENRLAGTFSSEQENPAGRNRRRNELGRNKLGEINSGGIKLSGKDLGGNNLSGNKLHGMNSPKCTWRKNLGGRILPCEAAKAKPSEGQRLGHRRSWGG
jgi:hypothetical protein